MEKIPAKEEMQRALFERHGVFLQRKISQTAVAVCGLGGLGSNIAVCLARSGIGRLFLLDFDRVDVANLHRQQYKAAQVGMMKTAALAANLREIAPYVDVITRTCRITEENLFPLLKDMDIVCEAFDDAEEKAMLVNGVLEQFPETVIVASSGMAGLASGNRIRTRRIARRFFLCGDGTSELSKEKGLFASRVMLCAAHQAHMVLRIIAGKAEI